MLKVILKRYFKTTTDVNCWFCNHNSLVSKKNRNSFICIHCDQYNGFKDDGDYNKKIPAQSYTELNPRFKTKKMPPQEEFPAFCNVCIDNETNKMELLNRFNPIDENSYYQEYDEYKKELECRFPLCYVCEIRVRDHLNEINNKILPDYIRWSTLFNRNNRINQCRQTIFSHLNVTPILMILSALIGLFLMQIHSYFTTTSIFYEMVDRHRTIIDIFLYSTLLAFSKLSDLRPSVKFGNAKLFIIFMIVASTTVMTKYSHGIPNFLLSVFKIPIHIWTLFILLEFCLRIVRLVRACSFTKMSKTSIGKHFTSLDISPSNLRSEYVSTNASVSYATNNNCVMMDNPFRKSKIGPSLLGDRSTQHMNSDTSSVCSFRSQNSENSFVMMGTKISGTIPSLFSAKLKSTYNDQSAPSSYRYDKSTTSNLFNVPLSSQSYRDNISVRSFKTQNSFNPFLKSGQVASLFGERGTSQYYKDTNSVKSHFSIKTNVASQNSTRCYSPMECDKTLSNHSQDTLAVGSPSMYTRKACINPTSQKSRAASVYSSKSHKSSSSSSTPKKARSTITKVAMKCLIGVVIGCFLNLAVMLFVAHLEPNLHKYF